MSIHGDLDRTFPIRYVDATIVVKNGGHELPLTHPQEVTEFLSGGLRQLDCLK